MVLGQLINKGGTAMPDYTAKRINEMEAGFGGGFVKVRAELGVTSFGMQLIQMPPDYADYPDHDHEESGQEEVFTTLSGGGWMEIDGERVEMDPETIIRVGPNAKRKVFAGAQGIRMLVVGATPGAVYELVPATELTAA
jgi:quercetin dioxygenase-like cupin family protein